MRLTNKENTRVLLLAQAVLYLLILFFFLPQAGGAQIEEEEDEVCEDSVAEVIIRDPAGKFIPGASVEIYQQVEDADGLPKPGKKVAGGTISAALGRFEYLFKGSTARGMHTVKVWDKNKSVGEFWFYDSFDVVCGQTIRLDERLSGIEFILRDTEGELVKNKEFSVYTQRYDADGDPIKEKQDFVAEMNTTEEGAATIYVSAGGQSLDGEERDYYVFDMPGRSGGTYLLYDINVREGALTEIEFILSDMELTLNDENGVPFPANTNIEIFVQAYDADDKPVLGTHIKDIATNDAGVAVFEYPAGLYAARILGADNKYEYFYELEITDNQRERYDLVPGEDWREGTGACEALSNINFVARDLDGKYIAGLNFGLYEVGADADGNPVAKNKLAAAAVDEHGRGVVSVHPDPRKKYALKIHSVNADAGDYWFFDNWQLVCGEDKAIEKSLSALRIVMRDGYGSLLKNQKFSLYTQSYDVDGKPVRETKALVSAALSTDETGGSVLYVAPDHPYNAAKRGTYVLTTTGANKAEYIEYDIKIDPDADTNLEYILSDIVFEFKDAAGRSLAGKPLDIYAQSRGAGGSYILGSKLYSGKTDAQGVARFEYPTGYYAAAIKDDLGQNNIFWQQPIDNRARTNKTLAINIVRIKAADASGVVQPTGTAIDVYALKEDENGKYYKDKKLKTFKTAGSGYAELSLAPGPYLFVAVGDKTEYGQALYTENGKLQAVTINYLPVNEVKSSSRYSLYRPTAVQPLADKLKGHILLQVEGRGEAWYVDMNSRRRYYMKDGATAYEMLRKFGLGITDADLEKIPVGLDERFEESDYDGDWVPDKMEEALGTDMYDADSDGDGYDDGEELKNGYDPLGPGKLKLDANFAVKQKGQILLQVESRGEAWYVNPKDGRRYYMKDGDSAYEIMRFLSLGITNANLEQIEADTM